MSKANPTLEMIDVAVFLLASADSLEKETLAYGPVRLLQGADRLIDAVLRIEEDEGLRALHEQFLGSALDLLRADYNKSAYAHEVLKKLLKIREAMAAKE
jgi:hypothetical protein